MARAGEIRQRPQQIVQSHALDRNVAFARESRVGAEQIILTLERQCVAGEVHEGQRVGTGGIDLGDELAKHTQHVGLAQVAAFDDLEADAAQRLGHEAGVVERRRQRARRIGRIADDQRDARLGLLGGGLSRNGKTHRAEHEQQDPAKHGRPL